MKGGRKLSEWNLFVKKIYHEGKSKNSKYEFKQALVDASKRKSEIASTKKTSIKKTSSSLTGGKTRSRTRSRTRTLAGGTHKHRKH